VDILQADATPLEESFVRISRPWLGIHFKRPDAAKYAA
jgi:hypothetical protein